MKNSFLIIFILSVFSSPISFAQDKTAGLQFDHGTFAELKAKAATEKKPIFIDAYTTWCGPCKWMSKSVFTQEEVGKFYNQNFINAKIDMEKGEGIELAKKYNVQAYPSLLYVDANGEIIHRSVGAREGKPFIELGTIALNPEINLAGLATKFKANPGSYEIAYPYLAILNDGGSAEKKTVFDSYFATQDKATWIELRNWRMLFDFVKNPTNPVFISFLENREQFAAKYTADSVDMKLKDIYYGQLQNAAYGDDKAAWNVAKKTIEDLKLKGSERFIASAGIAQAGEDKDLASARITEFMTKFGSEEPQELNQYAWSVYESSEDKKQLQAAEGWAKKGVSLAPEDPMIADTYAALLFKNGKKAEAKTQAEKAIELGKKVGADMSGTEELLKKIKEAAKPAATKKAAPKKTGK